MRGKLYAIGTGPGAPDLITVRAAHYLPTLDILYAPTAKKGGDSLALSIVRPYLSPHTHINARHFPMSQNSEEKQRAWQTISDEIVDDVNAGHQVGFISLGDIMLYSTWVSILSHLPDSMDIEIIPGITSFSFIAARTQRPLAMDTQSLLIMSSTVTHDTLAQAIEANPCLVLMKVATRFAEIKRLIEQLGFIDYAVLVSDASLTTEKQCFNLKDIDSNTPLSYFSTILINKSWPVI